MSESTQANTPSASDELWVSCPGFKRYEVSSWGRVRHAGTKRINYLTYNKNTGRHTVALYPDDPIIIPLKKPRIEKDGYKRQTRRQRKTVRLSGLIAEAFLGPRPEGMQIDHKDTNKLNDRADNLEYVTQSVNIQRSYERGCHPDRAGESNKLTPADYTLIHELWNGGKGMNQVQIARKLLINNSTVSKVLNGKIGGRVHPQMAEKAQRMERARELLAEDPRMLGRKLAAALGVTIQAALVYRRLIRGETNGQGETLLASETTDRPSRESAD